MASFSSLILAFALLSATSGQTNLLKLAHFVQERTDLSDRQSYLEEVEYTQFSILDTLLDVVSDRRNVLNTECAEDMRALVSARTGHMPYPDFGKLVWLPMKDSTGKFGPAIAKGHFHFAGHYSECINVDVELTGRERRFKADYFEVAVDLLFRTSAMNGSCTPTDSGQMVTWTFGVCLPASCSSAELERIFISDAGHNLVCRIMRTNDSIPDVNAGFYVVLSIMGIIVSLCVLSGIADFFLSALIGERISRTLVWRLFMAFSLYTNVSSIFDTSGATKKGQIAPIHCIRFLSMCWVMMCHLLGIYFYFVANPVDIAVLTKDLSTEFLLNAYFSVDTFFFVGGVLLTFLWFKNYERSPKTTNSPVAWAMVYVHRILRLSPPFYMALVFDVFVLKQLYRNSPGNMNDVTQLDDCSSWWFELTYLQNVIGHGSKCLLYDWYLATEMQMFLFTPLLIIPLALKPLYGFIVAAILLLLSTALNIFFVFHYHWPATNPFIGARDPEGVSTNLYYYYMYSSPVIGCQVYIIGMLIGWFLQTRKRLRINHILNIVLWLLSFTAMLTVVLGLHSETNGELLPVFWRAMYSAFSKPAWALALSWILVSCYYGYGGPINSFMSWHIWIPLGRLSYCGYLLQLPVGFVVMMQIHDEIYFSSFMEYIIFRLVPIIGVILFVSIFWSACFEISFGRMTSLLLGGGVRRAKTVERSDEKKFDDKLYEKKLDEVIRL